MVWLRRTEMSRARVPWASEIAIGSVSTGTSGWPSWAKGSIILWQKSHCTPQKSSPVRSEAFVGSERPSNHPVGEWHRIQRSTALGLPTAQMAS